MYAKLCIVSRSGRCCRHEVLSATVCYLRLWGKVRCYQDATGIYWSTRKDYWCPLQCKGELLKQHMGGLEYQAIITTVAILNYWIKLFFPDVCCFAWSWVWTPCCLAQGWRELLCCFVWSWVQTHSILLQISLLHFLYRLCVHSGGQNLWLHFFSLSLDLLSFLPDMAPPLPTTQTPT